MKLTDGEKLILFMLTDLYDHLGVEGEIDPSLVKEAILRGQPWALKEKYSGIFHEDASYEQAQSVSRILMMWRSIEEDYERLSDSDKLRLEEEVPYFGKNPKFEGFDANSGDGYYGTADFMVNHADLGWDHFKGRSLNSHGSATTAGHLRMLDVWSERAVNRHRGSFQVDDLSAILKARAHPDN